jgi:glycosyltransferase involved in cell wall biosynthesis
LSFVEIAGGPMVSERTTKQSMTRRLEAEERVSKLPPDEVTEVLFIIDQLCALGGAERVLLRTIKGLPRERYSPRVITFKIDESLKIADSINCPLHVFPLRNTYGWTALKVALQIRSLVRSHNVRITHTFHETSDLWGGIVAKLSGCPILISSRRDMGFLRERKHTFGYRLLGRCFDEVQTVSDEVRRFSIAQDALAPRKVVTIYNGIDLPPAPAGDKREFRARFGLEKAGKLVVSVGHVRKIKGFDVFMRAAARVREVMPEVTFAVAGEVHEPAHLQELTALAGKLGLGSGFVFLGDVSDVSSLLHGSDVFCLPSRSEGLSNALLEAMACGLPCVATRVGGNPEVVVEGKTGYIVESEDDESMAASLLKLLRDPEAARGMGVEGRKAVENKFTKQSMIRRLEQSYERLLVSTRRKSV